jgi:uncharacterized membrane protein (UPF0182 family)
MEPTLEQALAVIFKTEAARSPDRPAAKEPGPDPAATRHALGRQALDIWMRAQDALLREDLAQYGVEQRRLEETLRALREASR